MTPTTDRNDSDGTRPEAAAPRTRRALLALCLATLGLAACDGEAYWDSNTGQFRVPFGGQGGRAGNR